MAVIEMRRLGSWPKSENNVDGVVDSWGGYLESCFRCPGGRGGSSQLLADIHSMIAV